MPGPKPIYPKEKRILWYQSVDLYHRTVKETCQIFGISRKNYYHWKKRDFGLSGNTVNQSFKSNTKLTWEIRKFIEEYKLKYSYGPLKMKRNKRGQVPFFGLPLGFNVESKPNLLAILAIQLSLPNGFPLLIECLIFSNFSSSSF